MTQDQPENNDIKKPRRTPAKAGTKAAEKTTPKAPLKASKSTPKSAPKNAPKSGHDAESTTQGVDSVPKRTPRAPRAPKTAVEKANSQSPQDIAQDTVALVAEKEAKRTARRTPKKVDDVDSTASAHAANTGNPDVTRPAPHAEDTPAQEQAAPKARRTTRKPAAKANASTTDAAPVKTTSTAADSQAPKSRGGRGASKKSVDAPQFDAPNVPNVPNVPNAEATNATDATPPPQPTIPSAPFSHSAPVDMPSPAPMSSGTSPAPASPAPASLAPRAPAPLVPRAMRAPDDDVITHILPPLDERDDQEDGDSRRKRPRRRSRRKRKNEMQPFQPEGFADIYPSAGLTSVLPLNEPFVFSDDDDFEDDGPQPTLPNQPSLALPAALEDIDEEDLEALDAAVNGNRIGGTAHRNDAFGDSRFGRNRTAKGPNGKDKRGRNDRNERNDRGDRSERPDNRPDNRRQQEPDARPDIRHDARPDTKSGGKLGKPSRISPAVAPAVSTAPISDVAPMDDDDLPEIVFPTGKRTLYVSVVPDEQVEVVITDNGLVTEYFVEMAHQAKVRGNIYKGVVNNVDTNLQAAFVNFGSGKNGFLQIDEVHPEYWLTHHDATKGPKYPPIQKVMKVGQEVLVQVVKEPAGTKGAFLTTWVSLAGRFLVLTPGQEQIGVSRKVEDPEERARLKELLAGIDPGEDMGVIIRTASEGASKTSIQKDLQFLKRLWKDIRKRVSLEKAPELLHQEADLASRAVRDYLAEDIIEIWVDDEATLGSIREMTSLLFPRRTDMVKLHQDPRQTLWERFNLQRQLEEVSSREVVLPSGGRLVFDQTEALMAIDINSGKTQGKSNFEAMVFRTNMEAAEAIARHLRLRDIGGQVVIDFIEMRDRNHSRDVEKALRNAMRLDRARHDVGRMSSFGLLELVRQRTGTSAISISSEPCPHCHGTGVRRNMEWQALQALRDLQAKLVKHAAQNQSSKNRKYDPDVVKLPFIHEQDFELGLYLLNRKRDRLLELESRYNVKIEIHLKG